MGVRKLADQVTFKMRHKNNALIYQRQGIRFRGHGRIGIIMTILPHLEHNFTGTTSLMWVF
jgi:hypothetical protein